MTRIRTSKVGAKLQGYDLRGTVNWGSHLGSGTDKGEGLSDCKFVSNLPSFADSNQESAALSVS